MCASGHVIVIHEGSELERPKYYSYEASLKGRPQWIVRQHTHCTPKSQPLCPAKRLQKISPDLKKNHFSSVRLKIAEEKAASMQRDFTSAFFLRLQVRFQHPVLFL